MTQREKESARPRPCAARVHLRGADFAVYDAAMALTARSTGPRILLASRETLAQMTGYELRTAGLARARLVESGWLRPLASGNWQDDQRRTSGKGGSFLTPRFEVLTHDEWAALNPGKCPTVALSTDHGKSADGNSENGSTVHSQTANTVDGRTTDTVHGRTDHKALLLSPKAKPEKRSAGALPADGDSRDIKVSDRIRKFLGWWSKKYKDLHASTPTINWPRDTKRLRPLFEKNEDAVIEGSARTYLADCTEFTIGHPLGIFVSQFDRWRALGDPRGDKSDNWNMPTVEDDRPPDWEETQERLRAERGAKKRAS